jgi:CcmD family protein
VFVALILATAACGGSSTVPAAGEGPVIPPPPNATVVSAPFLSGETRTRLSDQLQVPAYVDDLSLYSTPASLADIEAFYKKEMASRQWEAGPTLPSVSADQPLMLFFKKGQNSAQIKAMASPFKPSETLVYTVVVKVEELRNLPFLIAAYFIIWIVMFGYIFFVARRQRALEHELEELRGRRMG